MNLPTLYQHVVADVAVVVATLAAAVLCILIHYEGLVVLAKTHDRKRRHERTKVLQSILSLLFLHVVEIWIFGIALWLLLRWPECGSLSAETPHLLDAVYFSALTFSTVGAADLVPVGPIRFLAGTEPLCGLVLITWSASFTYVEMERFWRRRE